MIRNKKAQVAEGIAYVFAILAMFLFLYFIFLYAGTVGKIKGIEAGKITRPDQGKSFETVYSLTNFFSNSQNLNDFSISIASFQEEPFKQKFISLLKKINFEKKEDYYGRDFFNLILEVYADEDKKIEFSNRPIYDSSLSFGTTYHSTFYYKGKKIKFIFIKD